MEIDLSGKCRTCLNECEEMHYLFTEFDQGISLGEILSNTTTYEISEDDGLSPNICQSCTTIIVDFYNLKVTCKENENQIRELLANLEPKPEEGDIKVQSVDDLSNTAKSESSQSEEEESKNILIKTEDYNDDDCSFDGNYSASEEKSDSYIDPSIYGFTKEEADNFEPETSDAIIQHEYQEVNTYSCPECDHCFLYKNDIINHLSEAHSIYDTNCEDFCEQNIIKVKKIDATALYANKCKICSQPFATIEAFKEHLETHKKNICDICGLGFVKRSYLKDHQEVHYPDKKHICQYCNKAFKRRTVLIKHKRIHTHPRECICEICGKAFNDKGTLKTHIMLLHLKSRNYSCNICGFKFPLKATLEKHIRRHGHKEREFACSKCPLKYKDKSSLDRHIHVKHSGQNVKIPCEVCGRQYLTTSSMMKHQRMCHQNEKIKEIIVLETQ